MMMIIAYLPLELSGVYWDGIGGLIFIMIKIMISKNGKNCEKWRKIVKVGWTDRC